MIPTIVTYFIHLLIVRIFPEKENSFKVTLKDCSNTLSYSINVALAVMRKVFLTKMMHLTEVCDNGNAESEMLNANQLSAPTI